MVEFSPSVVRYLDIIREGNWDQASIVYVVRAYSVNQLLEELEEIGVEVNMVHIQGLPMWERKWLIKHLMYMAEDAYEVLAFRSNPYKLIEARLDDMTTLELIDYIARNPRALRGPVVVNSFGEAHFGKKHLSLDHQAEDYLLPKAEELEE